MIDTGGLGAVQATTNRSYAIFISQIDINLVRRD